MPERSAAAHARLRERGGDDGARRCARGRATRARARRRRRADAARSARARRSRAPRRRARRPPPSRRTSSRCRASRVPARCGPSARPPLELLFFGLALDAELGHRPRAQARDADVLAAVHALAVARRGRSSRGRRRSSTSRPCSRSRRRPVNWRFTSEEAVSISSGKSSGSTWMSPESARLAFPTSSSRCASEKSSKLLEFALGQRLPLHRMARHPPCELSRFRADRVASSLRALAPSSDTP